MRRLKFISGALMGLALGLVGTANAADSSKPIVIPTHNWSSQRSEEHTSELQSLVNLVCRLLLEKKNNNNNNNILAST